MLKIGVFGPHSPELKANGVAVGMDGIAGVHFLSSNQKID
jgi:hypothetical protein